MNRKRLGAALALALALMITGVPAPATGADVVERELTLDEALALAKKRNKSLVAEQARVAQAQTNLTSAWARLLPTIAAQGKYTRNYHSFVFCTGQINAGICEGGSLVIQPVNQLDGVISFNAPLIVPAAWTGLQSVKAGIGAAEANFDVSETSVLFGVAQSFYAAGIADEVLVARRSSIEVTRATLKNAQTRLSAGTVTKVDVDRAELAVLRAEQLEREARQGREQTYRALATLIQIDGPFRVKIGLSVTAAPNLPDVSGALNLRPEFRALELSARAADLQAKTDAWRWAPSLSGFGNAHKFNYQNFNRNDYSWAIGVQLDWVLYDGGARDAERHLANAQYDENQARAVVLAESIRDDLANGRSLVDTKLRAVETATRSVELASETIDLVRTQYEAGTVTQVDLLQAQDGLVGAQEALAQARFDLAVADLTLRRTAGTFPPR